MLNKKALPGTIAGRYRQRDGNVFKAGSAAGFRFFRNAALTCNPPSFAARPMSAVTCLLTG